MEPCGGREGMLVVAVTLLVLRSPSGILCQSACDFSVTCTIQGKNSSHVIPVSRSDGTYQRQLPDGPLLLQSDGAGNVRIFSWHGENNSVIFKMSWTPPSASEGQGAVTFYELGMVGYTPGHGRLTFPSFYTIQVDEASSSTDSRNYILTINCSCSCAGVLRVMLTSVLGPAESCNFRQWAALLDAIDGSPAVLTPEVNVTFYPNRSSVAGTRGNVSGTFQVRSSWPVQEAFLEAGSCSSPLGGTALRRTVADGKVELKVAQEACKLYCLAITMNTATKRAIYISYMLPNMTQTARGTPAVVSLTSSLTQHWLSSFPHSSSPTSSTLSSSRFDVTQTDFSWKGTRLYEEDQKVNQSTQAVDRNQSISPHPDWLTGRHDVTLPADQEDDSTAKNTSSRSSGTPPIISSVPAATSSWPRRSPRPSSSTSLLSSFLSRPFDAKPGESSLLASAVPQEVQKSSQSSQTPESHRMSPHPDWLTEHHDATTPADQQEDSAPEIKDGSSFEKARSEFSETNSSVLFLSPSADPEKAGQSSVEANSSQPTSPPVLRRPSPLPSAAADQSEIHTWASVLIAGGLASAAIVAAFLAARQMYRRRRKSLRWHGDRVLNAGTNLSCMYTDFHSLTDINPPRCTTTHLFVLHRTVDKERLRNVHSFLHALEGALGGGVKLQEVVITSCAPAHFWPASSANSGARQVKVVLLLSSAVRNILKDVDCSSGSSLNSWRRCIMQDIPCRTPFYFFVLLSHDVLKNDDVRFFRSALPVERIFEIGTWDCEQYHALVDELSRNFEPVPKPDSDSSSFLPPQTFCDVISADVRNEFHRISDAGDLWSVKSSTYSAGTV